MQSIDIRAGAFAYLARLPWYWGMEQTTLTPWFDVKVPRPNDPYAHFIQDIYNFEIGGVRLQARIKTIPSAPREGPLTDNDDLSFAAQNGLIGQMRFNIQLVSNTSEPVNAHPVDADADWFLAIDGLLQRWFGDTPKVPTFPIFNPNGWSAKSKYLEAWGTLSFEANGEPAFLLSIPAHFSRFTNPPNTP